MNIIKKGGFSGILPICCAPKESKHDFYGKLAYCPEVAVLAEAAPAAGFWYAQYPRGVTW